MAIELSDHFTYGKLLRFTVPTMAMVTVLSLYVMVDGLFVSNFAGLEAFSALNLIYPFIMLLGTFGLMVGAGGSALVAKVLGEGNPMRANRIFSRLIQFTAVMGIGLGILAQLGMRPVARLLGASGTLLDQAILYGRIVAMGIPFVALQDAFQAFFSTAERPKLGLVTILAAGVTNMVLDWLFIAVFGWGLVGAAAATVIGQAVGGLVPLAYFARPNTSLLRLGPAEATRDELRQVLLNGSSELVTNLSESLVGLLFNYQLMRYLGQDGVSAYGVLMYINFVSMGAFYGYSQGVSPVVSFHYGAKDQPEIRSLFHKSLRLMAGGGLLITFVLAGTAAPPIVALFMGTSAGATQLTLHALSIYRLTFLVMGVNVFGSAFFTALNNGPVSAAISFLRTLVFEAASVMLLPALFGADGIWAAMVVAELVSLCVTCAFFVRLRGRYGYA